MLAKQVAPKTGLVLTGGGARAAYQAGVLQGISEILQKNRLKVENPSNPFKVLTGISAGAINAAYLAAGVSSFKDTANSLSQLWSSLKSEDVIRTDVGSISKLGAKWMRDLALGGARNESQVTHLLDGSPLRGFLMKNISFDQIKQNISNERIAGLGVTATNYATGTAITFFDSKEKLHTWSRTARIGLFKAIELEHILASASIPLFFEPTRIGDSFYGDGGIRMSTPLSPAIHLGSDRVIAIGVRFYRSQDQTLSINLNSQMKSIVLADIAGVLLNSLFLDALDSDVERAERINETISLLSEDARSRHSGKLRPVPILAIRPSVDLGTLASEEFKRFPRFLRYLLKGLGASEDKGWDLLSYLAFDGAYTQKLIAVGLQDAFNQEDEILRFLS